MDTTTYDMLTSTDTNGKTFMYEMARDTIAAFERQEIAADRFIFEMKGVIADYENLLQREILVKRIKELQSKLDKYMGK